jgi:hypothetical protein
MCYIVVLASYKSEAFATSFRPALNRGGSTTQKVLANPNGEYKAKNGASLDVVHHRNGVHKNGSHKNGKHANGASGNEADDLLEANYVAETSLPTELGNFRLRAYRTAPSSNPFAGNEPCVIYSAEKPPFGAKGQLKEDVPIRVHDQCFTSEVFGSYR